MARITLFFGYISILSIIIFHIEANEEINPFLSGSTKASIGQFPFQVAIRISEGSMEDVCNGALIKHKWVLTTANCIRDGKAHTVALGMIDSNNRIWESERILNSDITVHPGYNATSGENNIALIRVHDMPIPDGTNITTIEIPNENINLEGKEVRISGYGKTSSSGSIGDRALNFIDTKIASCPASNLFTKTTLCIETSASKSVCAGDLGSPMTAEISSKRVLLGIGRFTTDTCITDSVALFENVIDHREWIEKVSKGTIVSLSMSTAAVLIVMIFKNFI